MKCDKANWNSKNTFEFCEICIEEIRAGNTVKGVLTSRAYKNMIEKFEIRTGLKHSKNSTKEQMGLVEGPLLFLVISQQANWNGTTKRNSSG